MSRGALAPLLTEDEVIEAVLLLDGRDDREARWHLRPDSPMREAMRGSIPREAMARPERIAALIWANQGHGGTT